MRVVITGAGGQLGRALVTALDGFDVIPMTRDSLDITDPIAVAEALSRSTPDYVIHCAALTDTSRCEREPALAAQTNSGGAWNVAATCAQLDARLILISTNEVFDGESDSPYREDAERSPVNVYGTSKAQGERLSAEECADTLVVRTSWLYGDGGANFVERVLTAARAGGPLRFVTDEAATPTSAVDLALAIRELVESNAPAGVYHLSNEGEASRFAWAREIVRLAGMDESIVEPLTTAELRAGGYTGPRKPRYSVLANTRAREFGIVLRPWQQALSAYFERVGVTAHG